jgi:predicted O-methyltransferase YrrM
LLPQVDYLDFVSTLFNISKTYTQQFKPCKESQKILTKAFNRSIAPSTDEFPCSLEEALSLFLITRILRPKIAVETGVSAGRSSSYLLCALNENNLGKLYSIDPYCKAGSAIPEIIKDRWHFVNATSKEALVKLLSRTGEIDFFLHDSLHTYDNMLWEYETVWPHIRHNGILMSHDVNWNSSFKDFSKHINDKLVYLNTGFVAAKKLGE